MSATSLQPLGDGEALVCFESDRTCAVEITEAIVVGVSVPVWCFAWQTVEQWRKDVRAELERDRDDFLADQRELAL